MTEVACTKCNYILKDGKVCPLCKNTSFSKEWLGYVVVREPAQSEIARRLRITKKGEYALRVRT